MLIVTMNMNASFHWPLAMPYRAETLEARLSEPGKANDWKGFESRCLASSFRANIHAGRTVQEGATQELPPLPPILQRPHLVESLLQVLDLAPDPLLHLIHIDSLDPAQPVLALPISRRHILRVPFTQRISRFQRTLRQHVQPVGTPLRWVPRTERCHDGDTLRHVSYGGSGVDASSQRISRERRRRKDNPTICGARTLSVLPSPRCSSVSPPLMYCASESITTQTNGNSLRRSDGRLDRNPTGFRHSLRRPHLHISMRDLIVEGGDEIDARILADDPEDFGRVPEGVDERRVPRRHPPDLKRSWPRVTASWESRGKGTVEATRDRLVRAAGMLGVLRDQRVARRHSFW
ncbi:hypothetical protein KC326_g222 [Hortaea werneckii]|nr:hypothetical protein KC326_g222 [Hortaea werneckii]